MYIYIYIYIWGKLQTLILASFYLSNGSPGDTRGTIGLSLTPCPRSRGAMQLSQSQMSPVQINKRGQLDVHRRSPRSPLHTDNAISLKLICLVLSSSNRNMTLFSVTLWDFLFLPALCQMLILRYNNSTVCLSPLQGDKRGKYNVHRPSAIPSPSLDAIEATCLR